jgi:D-glycerate 3-kinase
MALSSGDAGLERHFVAPLLEALRALALAARAGGRRQVVALNGPVGAGKSTLARQLLERARGLRLRLAVASIDDFYLPWEQRRQVLAGNPFGVWRVPPGSHDVPLALASIAAWQAGEQLCLPRFDKTLRGGQGDRSGEQRLDADVLLLEGWLLGCQPLPPDRLQALLTLDPGEQLATPALLALGPEERRSLPHWNDQLMAYGPLWTSFSQLWLLRPQRWALPRRWRFQAEAQQRRAGGAWLKAAELDRLVRASLASLPPALYQDPLRHHATGWAELDGRRRWIAGTTPSSAPLAD